MKKAATLFLASLFVVTSLTACGNSENRQLAEREDQIEDQADKQKEQIDKNAEAQKDKIEQQAEQKKDAIDQKVEQQTEKLDAQKDANKDAGKADNMNGKKDAPAEKN